ncbi:helix-turn-helix domain-containing protein [Natrarchaeobius oligotrophus]|uniref:MarR family transcriptional regulator n=1 Tax=Natrarchaeobius chitinivorans TaxID=1679083 RepID=A0A3N6MXC8_NATCH|nr:helix-turn-helix domain-containing protein [Natrarchaeobius chitinivorans]RQG99666.1 MarR family transcriptional regulator [Natrarchaeobius chitinivorans]
MNSTAAQDVGVSMPDDITSARAKLVYYYLATNDGATVNELHAELDISKGTVLSITGTLRDRGHLERTDGRYVAV